MLGWLRRAKASGLMSEAFGKRRVDSVPGGRILRATLRSRLGCRA